MGTALALRDSLANTFLPQRKITNVSDSLWDDDGPSTRRAGQNVTPDSALTFSGCWCATNAIAGFFGSMPAKVYRKTPDGREEQTTHDVHRVIGREPNPDMDSFIFWEMLTQWWVNYGNGFAEIQRHGASGKIAALWPIHPTRVKPELDNDRNWTGRWLVASTRGQSTPIDAADMFTIVGNLSDDGLTGKGVIQYAANAIGTALAEQSYRADFYGKGGRPSGVLEHPDQLGPEARDNLRREWRTVHARGNEIAILWEGMKFTPTSVSPEHAQIIESSVYSIQEMARFYDLPPHVLYELSNGTFANTEEMNRFLVSHSFNRRMVRVEKACDRQLFSDREKQQGYYIKFNINALLRGNPKEQADINQIKLQNGVINQDEWRAQNDQNKLADGQGSQYWMRRDMAPTKLVIESAKRSVEETTPLISTPATPDTPPALSDGEATAIADLATSRTLIENLTGTIKDNAAELEASTEQKQSLQDRLDTATESLAGADAQAEKAEAENTTLALSEQAERERADSNSFDLETSRQQNQSLQDRLDTATESLAESESAAQAFEECFDHAERDRIQAVENLTGTIEDKTAELEASIEQKQSLQDRLNTATESLTEAESTATAAKESLGHAEREHAQAFDNANTRGDTFKAKAESQAIELGELRAEHNATAQRLDKISTEHDKAKDNAASLQEQVAAYRVDAEKTSTDVQAGRERCYKIVAASVRALLDESLDSLLLRERNEAKGNSRNYDRFKVLTKESQLSFAAELSAHLAQAAAALESVGHDKVDTSAIVARYMTDSRRLLNIAHNGAKRNEIRSVIQKEVATWEPRKALLINWIGE